MKTTNLLVTKLKHGEYFIDCAVHEHGIGRTQWVVSSWSHYSHDLIEVQAVCLSYMRSEVVNVVKKDSWLHRCRTARPDSVVLSLCWDGLSGDQSPATPAKWVRVPWADEDGVEVDDVVDFKRIPPSAIKWIQLPFVSEQFKYWACGECEGLE